MPKLSYAKLLLEHWGVAVEEIPVSDVPGKLVGWVRRANPMSLHTPARLTRVVTQQVPPRMLGFIAFSP